MRKLVIAISGPPGSGASTVGGFVAKKLKMKYFSPGKYFKKMSGKKNETEAAISFLKTKRGTSKSLHERIDELQIGKARKGNIVLEGSLSIHFLKNIADHKIWVYASKRKRAERTSKRDNVPVTKALKKVLEREATEIKLFKNIYGFDYMSQKKIADLIIDSSNLTINQTVEKILKFIKSNKLKPRVSKSD
ncbi:MAG: cytidylate kinase family protein [Candidatus Aenigmarchaeota archaeon]|nr:cytidylate kinase family protein [Candidatus Aenigmarchaeota archaeon]